MPSRLLNLLSHELSNLHSAALVLGASALASQILALVRDRLLAHQFGAGATLDVYYAAFRIPDFIFVSIASFVSVSVLIPFLAKTNERGKEDTQAFLNTIFTLFSFLIVIVCAIMFFLVPTIASKVVPGFSDVALAEYITFTRILLLSPLFFGFSNLLTSIIQLEHKFLTSAFAPLLYNIGIISGVLLWYPIFGANGLVFGVVLGAFLHCMLQLVAVLRSGFVLRFTRAIDFGLVRAVAILSFPRTLALGAQQLVILVLVGFATSMYSGSIAVFNFAFNLQSVPLSIIGVSYSTAAFPTLAKLFKKGARDEFIAHVATTAQHILFWLLPASSLFIILRAQIVRTILGSGHFDWTDTRLTAALLALFAVSLMAQSLVLLFTRAYYAAGSTIKPLVMNVGVAIGTIFLALWFKHLFVTLPAFRNVLESLLRVQEISGTAVLILPLAFSVGSVINALLHWISFTREFPGFTRSVLSTLTQVFVSSVIMGFVTYQSLNVFVHIFDINTFWGIFLQGFISGLFGIISGVVILKLFRNRELEDITKALEQKFWRTKPIVPGTDEQLTS